MRVIGLTGRNCAGKDAIADFLEDRRFERHSLSDAIREELRTRGRRVTRESLIALGNELRRVEGPATLAERMKTIIRTARVVLVSVRSVPEVESLRDLDGFRLVAVEAPPAVRFAREHERNPHRGEGTAPDLEAFLALEALEDTDDPATQQLGRTIALADHVIHNDGTLEDLERKVETLLQALDAGDDRS